MGRPAVIALGVLVMLGGPFVVDARYAYVLALGLFALAACDVLGDRRERRAVARRRGARRLAAHRTPVARHPR